MITVTNVTLRSHDQRNQLATLIVHDFTSLSAALASGYGTRAGILRSMRNPVPGDRHQPLGPLPITMLNRAGRFIQQSEQMDDENLAIGESTSFSATQYRAA